MQFGCRGPRRMQTDQGDNTICGLTAHGFLSEVDAGLHGVQLDCTKGVRRMQLPVGGLTVCGSTEGEITICRLTVRDPICASERRDWSEFTARGFCMRLDCHKAI